MARPLKQTVDYFPHDTDASDGKTLTILQAKYGNDGYAFWFKLLQLLGRREGHYIDYNKPDDWQFMLGKTHVTEDTANSILATLVDLEAIDPDLAKKKIIWCQHFVDGVADAYSRRQADLPVKPGQQPQSEEQSAPLDFKAVLEELRPKYPDLDVDEQWEDCQRWWREEHKKMKHPQSALKNWLDKARKIQGTSKPVEEDTSGDWEG